MAKGGPSYEPEGDEQRWDLVTPFKSPSTSTTGFVIKFVFSRA